MRFLVGMSLLVVFHASVVFAQQPPIRVGPVYTKQSDVVSVVIEFPDGVPTTPRAADFRLLLANGDLVAIGEKSQSFRDSGEGLALVICVDVSGTIGQGPLKGVKDDLLLLLGKASSRLQDKIALISFSDDDKTESSFEETRPQLAAAIRNLQIRGNQTKIYQTVFKALERFQGAGLPARKRILLISDGKDEGSVEGPGSVTAQSRSMGIPIDTVGYGKIEPQYVQALSNLSRSTGGQFVHARPDRLALSDALARIYEDLLETRSLVVSFKYKYKADKAEDRIQNASVELKQLGQASWQGRIPQWIPRPLEQTVVVNKPPKPPGLIDKILQGMTNLNTILRRIPEVITNLSTILQKLREPIIALTLLVPAFIALVAVLVTARKRLEVACRKEFEEPLHKAKAEAKDIEDAVAARGARPVPPLTDEGETQPARAIVLEAWKALQQYVYDACTARKMPVTPATRIAEAARQLGNVNAINTKIASLLSVLDELGQKLADNPGFKPQKDDAREYKALADVVVASMMFNLSAPVDVAPVHVAAPKPLRQTVVGGHFPPPQRGASVAWLVGIRGPVLGQRFSIAKEDCRLGSHADNDLCIPDDEYVSSHHASLRYEQGSLFLYDQESRNGTFLNDKPVTRTPVLVRQGDQIRLGASVFQVAEAPNEPSLGPRERTRVE